MKVKQSNPTVIEIQTNTLDEKQIRKRFERLGYDEEVYLVLLIESDTEEKEVGKQPDDTISFGVYDVTTQEEDNSLVITDLSQYLKPELSIEDEEAIFPSSTFVIKCNLCNYSWVGAGSFSQVRQHNRSEDHHRKLATPHSYKLGEQSKDHSSSSALVKCLGELIKKHRDKIKKILIDMSAGAGAGEIQVMTSLLSSSF